MGSNTLTPLLKRMETAGWLGRKRDSKDERQVRLTLSDAGRVLAADAAQIPADFAEKTGFKPSELADLRDVLAALRDRLKPAKP